MRFRVREYSGVFERTIASEYYVKVENPSRYR